MKKVTTLVAAGLILSGATVSIASAQSLGVDADVNVGVSVDDGAASMRADTDMHARGSAQRDDNGDDNSSKKSDQDRDNDMNDDRIGTEDDASVDMDANAADDADDDSDDDATRGETTSAEHRSAVAAFVQSLLGVADREQGGIGAQVRAIAHEEDETGSTTVEAMTKVEDRGSLRTFLFGSDYKNLGVIRSGIATTSVHIEQLTRMRDAATSASEKAELSVHIDALASARAKLDAYVMAHEDVFSVFGWFVRLFGNE